MVLPVFAPRCTGFSLFFFLLICEPTDLSNHSLIQNGYFLNQSSLLFLNPYCISGPMITSHITARIKLLNAKTKTHHVKKGTPSFNHYSEASDFGSLDPAVAADWIAGLEAVCYSGQMAANIVD